MEYTPSQSPNESWFADCPHQTFLKMKWPTNLFGRFVSNAANLFLSSKKCFFVFNPNLKLLHSSSSASWEGNSHRTRVSKILQYGHLCRAQPQTRLLFCLFHHFPLPAPPCFPTPKSVLWMGPGTLTASKSHSPVVKTRAALQPGSCGSFPTAEGVQEMRTTPVLPLQSLWGRYGEDRERGGWKGTQGKAPAGANTSPRCALNFGAQSFISTCNTHTDHHSLNQKHNCSRFLLVENTEDHIIIQNYCKQSFPICALVLLAARQTWPKSYSKPVTSKIFQASAFHVSAA